MQRYIVIGDIHGCYDELMQLLEAVQVTEKDIVVAVGDIVDRGPDSVKVYEFFKAHPQHKVIMGNHERKHLKQVLHYGQEIVKLQFGEQYREFLEWAAQLPYFYKTSDAIIVHGGFVNGVEAYEQKEEVLCASTAGEKYLTNLYGTEHYWPEFYTGTKPIVFGHHVVGEQPQVWHNTVYGIDTGACHGMRLTAISLPDFTVYSVPARANHWGHERYNWQLPVLKAKPWKTFLFKKIEEEIQPFRDSEREDVQAFVAALDNWLQELKALVPELMQRVLQKVRELEQQHGENFNREAHKLFYSSLLFASRKGSLTETTLWQTLNSPEKIRHVAQEFGLPVPEFNP